MVEWWRKKDELNILLVEYEAIKAVCNKRIKPIN